LELGGGASGLKVDVATADQRELEYYTKAKDKKKIKW
jgi:hypothetical protein